MICFGVVPHLLFRRIVVKMFSTDYLMVVVATLTFVLVRKTSILLYVSSV